MRSIRAIWSAALAGTLILLVGAATAQEVIDDYPDSAVLAAVDPFYPPAGGPYAPSEASQNAPPRRLNEGDLPEIRRYTEHVMEQWQVPGLALAIVQDGEPFLVEGFGVRDIASGAPMDADTLIHIASLTKAFTTTAITMLVQDGLLGWDEPVVDYYPAFQLQDPDLTQQLLMRDIVTHRTGFNGPAMDSRLLFRRPEFYSRYEIVARLANFSAAAPIRSRYSYNSSFYVLAGVVMEEVTGKAWEEIIHERIFEPLGMTRSRTAYYDWPDDNYSRAYERRAGTIKKVPFQTTENMAPAGGILSTAADMAKWMVFQLGRGTYAGEEILAARYVDDMHDAHMVKGEPAFFSPVMPGMSWFNVYGLGWTLNDYRGRRIVRHTGCHQGTRANLSILPSEGFGVVVLTNRGACSPPYHVAPAALIYRIIDAYLGNPERNWSEEFYRYLFGE